MAQHHIGNALTRLHLGFFDQMRIVGFGGCRAGVPKLPCHCDNIGVVGNQYAGHGMAKCMPVDVWQVMPCAEFGQSSGNTVRMHGTAIVPGEDETSFFPVVAVEMTKLFQLFLILTQQINHFRWDRDMCFPADAGITMFTIILKAVVYFLGTSVVRWK